MNAEPSGGGDVASAGSAVNEEARLREMRSAVTGTDAVHPSSVSTDMEAIFGAAPETAASGGAIGRALVVRRRRRGAGPAIVALLVLVAVAMGVFGAPLLKRLRDDRPPVVPSARSTRGIPAPQPAAAPVAAVTSPAATASAVDTGPRPPAETVAASPIVSTPAPAKAEPRSPAPARASADPTGETVSDRQGRGASRRRDKAQATRAAQDSTRGLCSGRSPQYRHACLLDALDDADARLRVAYEHAVDADVPRATLVAIRSRWSQLRGSSRYEPAWVVAQYRTLAAELRAEARDGGE